MRVYLDWNATAPPLPACIDAMVECAREAWGNPASIHTHGRLARGRVEGAREAVALRGRHQITASETRPRSGRAM